MPIRIDAHIPGEGWRALWCDMPAAVVEADPKTRADWLADQISGVWSALSWELV
jgi:hypothetical protein